MYISRDFSPLAFVFGMHPSSWELRAVSSTIDTCHCGFDLDLQSLFAHPPCRSVDWPKLDWPKLNQDGLNGIGQSRSLPKGGVPKGCGPNISRFFSPSPAPIFALSSLSGSLLVEFWWFFEGRETQMCTFGLLDKRVETPAASGPPGLSPRAQTCTFEGPGLHKNHQNSTRRHTVRERKITKWWRERGKKRAKFWGVRRKVVQGSPNQQQPQQHIQQHTTQNTQQNTQQHTTTNNTQQTKWAGQRWIGQNWIGQSRPQPFSWILGGVWKRGGRQMCTSRIQREDTQ